METGAEARELCCSALWKENLSSRDNIEGKLRRNNGDRGWREELGQLPEARTPHVVQQQVQNPRESSQRLILRGFFFFFESTDYLKKDRFVIIEDLRNKVNLVNLGNTEIIIK